jgi:YD repeat-containing protein
LYTYDEAGNLKTQTDARLNVTTFEYDKLGRRTKRILPGTPVNGPAETIGYSIVNQTLRRTVTDFNGQMVFHVHDVMDRLLEKRVGSMANTPVVAFTYTVTGRRQTMSDASGTTVYAYDSRDRLITRDTPQGTLTYTYDNNGNLTRLQSANLNGTDVAYQWDALNRLQNVTDNRLPAGNNTTVYGYYDVGNLHTVTSPNGVFSLYAYDEVNRLTSLTLTKDGNSRASYTYALGFAGKRSDRKQFS